MTQAEEPEWMHVVEWDGAQRKVIAREPALWIAPNTNIVGNAPRLVKGVDKLLLDNEAEVYQCVGEIGCGKVFSTAHSVVTHKSGHSLKRAGRKAAVKQQRISENRRAAQKDSMEARKRRVSDVKTNGVPSVLRQMGETLHEYSRYVNHIATEYAKMENVDRKPLVPEGMVLIPTNKYEEMKDKAERWDAIMKQLGR